MSLPHDRRSASDDDRGRKSWGARYVAVDFFWAQVERDILANATVPVVADALAEREGGFMSRMWANERAASASLTLALEQAPGATRMLDVYSTCAGRDHLWQQWKSESVRRQPDAFVGYMMFR